MTHKPKSEHITLRIEPELRAALAAAADEDRRPVSNLVRCVLSDWLASRALGERASA